MKIIYTPEREKYDAKVEVSEGCNATFIPYNRYNYNVTFLKVPDYNISYSKKIGDVVKGFFIAQSLPTISFEKSKQTVKIEFMSSEEYHAIVFKEKFSPDIPYTPPIASIGLVDVVDISNFGATINVSIVTKTGIELDTDPSFSNPIRFEIDGAANSVDVSGLEMDTQYYVRGYIVKDGSTIYSNNVLEFRTLEIIPTISLIDITDITDSTANVNVSIADGEDVSKTGVEIDTDPLFSNPTAYEENGAVNTIAIDNLTAETTYYVRGYVVWNGQTIYSANTLNFTTASGSILPAELQGCEWLQSDGNAYIKLPASITLALKGIDFEMQVDIGNLASCVAMCGRSSTYLFQLYYASNRWNIRYYDVSTNPLNTSTSAKNIILKKNGNTYTLNGDNYVKNFTLHDINEEFSFFGQIYGGLALHPIKVYYFISSVIELYSCFVKDGQTFTDNKGNTCQAGTCGMYDIVNQVFYTNDGTGTFSHGADINI